MKPNAALKSWKVNVRLMASRPFTSLQPWSLASAALRALAVSFSGMVGTSCEQGNCGMNRVAAATRIGAWSAYLINANTPTRAPPEAFMSWSFNIGRIAGAAILVHVTFVLFPGWIFVARWVAGGPGSGWRARPRLVR